MFNLDNLEKVEQANSRINYDLRFSDATRKFTLSEQAYADLNMNENGFNLFRDKETKQVVLAVVPNEEATIHKGRSDADKKGKTFTADSLASKLGISDTEDPVEYVFNETVIDEVIYLELERLDEEEDKSITDNGEEDVPGDEAQDLPSQEMTNEETEEGVASGW